MSYIIQKLLGYAYWSHENKCYLRNNTCIEVWKGFQINKIQGLNRKPYYQKSILIFPQDYLSCAKYLNGTKLFIHGTCENRHFQINKINQFAMRATCILNITVSFRSHSWIIEIWRRWLPLLLFVDKGL